MLRSQALRTLASATRAPPVAARLLVLARTRSYVTPPDPTHPTDAPKPTDKPSSNTTFYLLIAGTLAGVGGWYALQGDDAHDRRVADQKRIQQKAQELKDAGKATAHDAVREGEQHYDATRAAAKDKLSQARAEAEAAAADAKAKVDALKSSAVSTYNDASHKVEQTYADAKHKAEDAVHQAEATTQSWGSWLGSWFGYGKAKTQAKADEAKREGAQKVADGAAKVEKEAQKRA